MLDVSADQRFAKLLVERGKLRDADMTRALRVQEGQASRERLSRLIVRLGLISERDAADTLSEILERQVARLADEQRRQLGQQVHDSLGQQLTAIGLLVGTLRSRLGTGDSVADVTSNLERCVDDAKAHMRAIVKGLAPLKIDAHGLQFALAELAQGTALTHGIACRLECPHPVALHDNFTANELYLIAREAVHNAVKHGRPGSIVIRLESSQGLLLQIWDDGVGIARARERAHEGFGLRIMRYRSRLIGATLKVVRGANGGTVVTCTRTRPGQGACLVATPTVADANGLTAKTTSNSRGRRATPHACRAPLLSL